MEIKTSVVHLLMTMAVVVRHISGQALLSKIDNTCVRAYSKEMEKAWENDKSLRNQLSEMKKRLESQEQIIRQIRENDERQNLYLHLSDANQEDYIGGRGGSPFDDYKISEGKNITAVTIMCSSEFVFSIQFKYGNVWGDEHGNSNNPLCGADVSEMTNHTSVLQPSEYIISLHGKYTNILHYLALHTNMRQLETCESTYGDYEMIVNGTRLVYVSGKSGCVIDGLQPHWLSILT